MTSAWSTGVGREARSWGTTASGHQDPEEGNHRDSYKKPSCLSYILSKNMAPSSLLPSRSHSSSQQTLKPEPERRGIWGNVVPSFARKRYWYWVGKRQPGYILCWDVLALPGDNDSCTECLERCLSISITFNILHMRTSYNSYDF